jgi:alpha-mannosidase
VASTRSAVVELELPGTGDAPGLQVLGETPPEVELHDVDVAEAATVVERELDIHPELVGVALDDGGEGVVVTLTAGDRLLEAPPAEARSVIDRLRGLSGERPGARVRVDLHQPPRRRALAATGPVRGYGWRAWRPVADYSPVTAEARGPGAAMSGTGVEVDIDATTGTWSLNGVPGFGRLVDDGDAGDTYNYSPPTRDRVIADPVAVTVEVAETGPLRAAVELTATYDWPDRIDDGERTGSVSHRVHTRLELRSDEAFVRVTTTIDNRSRDHRLRAWFPLPHPAATSRAECAFGTVERGLTAEGGPTERGLPTFPSRRFVTAGGLTIAHEGLLEYELVDRAPTGPDGGEQAHAVALTLLRATGMLSRGPMTNRPLPAGPTDPLDGPQLQKPVTVRYAVAVGAEDPYRLAEDVFVPILVTNGRGADGGAREGQALELHGAVVSAVERRGGALHVRVFNPGPDPTTVTVRGRRGWLLDLAERPLAPFEDDIELGGHRIATLALEE